MSNDSLDTAIIKKSLRVFISKPELSLAHLDSYNEDDSFMEKGILDSTGILELVGFIEKTFGLRVESDEITPDNLDSLNKLAAFIMRKKTRGDS